MGCIRGYRIPVIGIDAAIVRIKMGGNRMEVICSDDPVLIVGDRPVVPAMANQLASLQP